ncbi:CcoQ/FixQ family Cbb3-type cytochrome c oxidase assembly chaperone [Paracrocinitomix mangrovi]|uniref:CcoQ/FixQ family Cbb3-type cytochrome c oxidase assembly chaperone n=1 Tax=Paracrocinitomix mangrovi TaxID=2862509 RepID=UPI001C8D9BE0|nr:CcoQ/FixQ family Cbb3-type cytochrome c oxidase assembly chaperone [Paracrocinitomix mangrovi]UKN01490.1 CcoQ/FixQ family Cbb3-type cytochrome c oxidase assembly chaperone [Paracrocinitomix mangrovi]
MLSDIKGYLNGIEGVEIYPIISFIIFFSFFIGLSFYVFKLKKSRVEELKNIPLDDEN